MKEDILSKLVAVINALNMVSVSGKSNLNNLVASISVLEEVVGTLHSVEISDNVSQSDQCEHYRIE